MFRYFKLYLYFIRFSFSRHAEFRLDFFFRIIMDIFYYASAIAFFKVLFLHTGQLGGWSEDEAMVFVGATLIGDGIMMTFFSNNCWNLPNYINRGDLDYYLVRPVSSLFFLGLRDIAVPSFVNLAMGMSFFAYALHHSAMQVSFAAILTFGALIFVGASLHYILNLIFIMPTFWTHSGRELNNVYWSLARYSERPHGIYKGAARLVLLYFVPFGVMYSLPASYLIENASFSILLHVLGVTAVFLAVLMFLWGQGMRAYSSASS